MKIIWSPEAADEFEAAVEYLSERNSAAAAKLANAILTIVDRLAAEPLDGPEYVLAATGEVVRGWPYPPFRIYYQRAHEALLVLRVYDQGSCHLMVGD